MNHVHLVGASLSTVVAVSTCAFHSFWNERKVSDPPSVHGSGSTERVWDEGPPTGERLHKGKGKGRSKISELDKLTMPVGMIVDEAGVAWWCSQIWLIS